MKYILLIAFFIQFASIANAANWYVDNAATGSNRGKSWANAWRSFAAIQWATINPGDTLYISGGSISKKYTSTLTIGKSGTKGLPITIRPGQDAGHNGEVIFDFDSLGDAGTGAGIDASNRSYIVIDGSVGSSRKLTIKNLRNTTLRYEAPAIYANPGSYITVQYVNIDNSNNGVRIAYGTGINVNNNSFTRMRGDGVISLLACTGEWDANIVHHNYIGIVVTTSGGGGPDGIQHSSGVSVYNNTFKTDKVTYATSTQHPDYIQAIGSYHKIYNNDFINIGDSGYNGSGDYGAGRLASTPHDIWIYNNTFRIVDKVDTYPEYIRFYACGASLTNFKVFNNTFIDNDSPNTRVFYIDCGTDTTIVSGIEIKNNIWYKSGLGAYHPALYINGAGFTAESFSIDNNIYYGGAYVSFLGKTYTAANWISTHEPHGSTAKPTFVSYSPNNINNDLHLSPSDTAAKGKGFNLSGYFTTDKDSALRTVPWSIGAYK